MEEIVGQAWDRLINRAALRDFPEATVNLAEIRPHAALLFRALGGDPGLRIEATTETAHGARRSLAQRIAGRGRHVELAWRDEETLRLPGQLSHFPTRELNRELYLWLAALATQATPDPGDWLQRNARATATLLTRYPGLRSRYRRLVDAHLQQRHTPAGTRAGAVAREQAIREALQAPASVAAPLPDAPAAPAPVPLWLHPCPPLMATGKPATDDPDASDSEDGSRACETEKRRRGERVKSPDGRGGLLAFRLESLFTRAEYANVDRSAEENEDNDAKSAIDDLDVLSMARDRRRTASRLRFDLDLPPEAHDDIHLGDGIPLPEWDYRSQQLLPDHCRLQPLLARDAAAMPLPPHLRHRARRLRAMFEMITPHRLWVNGQPEGTDIDINAVITHAAERAFGREPDDAGVFRNFRNTRRDLSCLLLADLSLSTDTYINNDHRVIDVIRDSLFLFSEALSATGDRFSLYGFSSRNRGHVRMHTLKTFEEKYTEHTRGRIAAIRPGYYTRMGAAIRHASTLLLQENSSDRLLLMLTDGKPNDLDLYEGRYGIEDTRMALHEARRAGIRPFCVTIDDRARDYLPYLFGSNAWMLVRNAGELPAKLPLLYARLTA